MKQLQKNFKIRLTGIPSTFLGVCALLALITACAGTPPKMERPITLWNGSPEHQAMCHASVAKVTAWAKKALQKDISKKYAAQVLHAALTEDASTCISASDPKFSAFVGLTADDLRVLLQYQENLLYSCEKWGTGQ